jgi:hypothetical protein
MQEKPIPHKINLTREGEALLTAMQHEGCPVCQVVMEAMKQAMDTWRYEGFTDVEQRYVAIRARGFCPLHTWQLARHHTSLPLALVYQNIVSDILEQTDLASATLPKPRISWLTRLKYLFRPPNVSQLVSSEQLYTSCPFCRVRANAEQRILDTFLSLFSAEQTQLRFRQSTGLCRLHFLRTLELAQVKKPAQRYVLIQCQRACLQRLLEELQEQIRKSDYHADAEERGEEMTAWRRAAKWNAGNPGVY